jgi:D-aminoacyl-tRNA deacylase
MKAVIQKSGPAKVTVDGKTTGQINSGLVILLGVTHEDDQKDLEYLVEKINNMRLFRDEEKHFQLSISETSREILVISQFTLYASCKKGRRPDFNNAAKPEVAEPLYEQFIEKLKEKGLKVECGKFGAMMEISLVNMGPVTIIIDSKNQS